MSPRADDLLRPVTPGYDGPLPEGTRGLYAGTGGYVGYNLFSEREKGPTLNAGGLTPAMFTPEAARAAGN